MTELYECPKCGGMETIWPVIKKRRKYYRCTECGANFSSKQLDKMWGLESSEPILTVIPVSKKLSGKDFFDLTNTGIPYYNDMLNNEAISDSRTTREYFLAEGIESRISWIAINTYFEETAKIHGSTPQEELDIVEPNLAYSYRDKAVQGSKMPLPIIDYIKEYQEGRHRVVAGKLIGLNRIPVLIVTPASAEAQQAELDKQLKKLRGW